MAPEYGCTTALFPVDQAVLDYLAMTGRDPAHVSYVREYAMAQSLWADEVARNYARELSFDLSDVGVSAAGPRRPQDKVALADVGRSFSRSAGPPDGGRRRPGRPARPADGDIAIAAITSCTNTSNPEAMLTAGLSRARPPAGAWPRRHG